MKISSISKLLILTYVLLSIAACNTKDLETKQEGDLVKDSAIMNWQDRKFSMFIHWGLYSIPAGVWNGEKVTYGYSEQIQGCAKIPNKAYAQLALKFNPEKWNPDSIVVLAKQAGMKSIVITAKHHDGFNMFNTAYSDYNVVDATPYKRDVIKELSESCKRYNLGFGVYFSLIDWNYPGAAPFESVRNSDSIPEAHHQYNLNQVRELLTKYGEISEIWFDMGSPTFEQSREIAKLVKSIQPDCMISGRLWNGQGDFIVMGDNKQPDYLVGVPWQTPASMFDETWGCRSWQERCSTKEKIKEKIHDLIHVVSAGGNYLLNIGPRGDGSVVPFEEGVLKGVGQWLSEYGEAIYETDPSPIGLQSWGAVTARSGKLYLHITQFPENNKLLVEQVHADDIEVYPLNNKNMRLKANVNGKGVEIEIPDSMERNEFATVIVIEHKGDLNYRPHNLVLMSEQGEFLLTTANAELYHSSFGHDYYSSKPTVVKMKWILTNCSQKKMKLVLKCRHFNTGETLCLLVNEDKYLITLAEPTKTIEGHVHQYEPITINLDTERVNSVELYVENPSNLHKGLGIEELNIVVR